ncbi:MAG: TIGR02147 family protein [Xanthomonadaceae bacterium]|nr:TIGR02147 family protein [Xanthomonadaceae bacterium]
MQTYTNYRDRLRSEMMTRTAKNSRYSLRAFARDLKIEPARLSDILNGKKGLSRSAAEQWAQKLGWDDTETEFFCDLVESEHARNPIKRQIAKRRALAALEKNSNSLTLTLDAFRTISDWYPMAILELLKLNRTVHTSSWIASELGITPIQVTDALERLERLELIERKDSKWIPIPDAVLSPDGVPSTAIKSFHDQTLTKAIQALYTQSVSDRDFYTYVIPARSKDLPEIRSRVRKFITSLVTEFGNVSGADTVLNLSNQVFQLTQPLSEGETE